MLGPDFEALTFDVVVMTLRAVTLIFDVVVIMSHVMMLWHSFTQSKQT